MYKYASDWLKLTGHLKKFKSWFLQICAQVKGPKISTSTFSSPPELITVTAFSKWAPTGPQKQLSDNEGGFLPHTLPGHPIVRTLLMHSSVHNIFFFKKIKFSGGYFSETMLNLLLHLSQQRGFIVETEQCWNDLPAVQIWKQLVHHGTKNTPKKIRDCWRAIIRHQSSTGQHSFP